MSTSQVIIGTYPEATAAHLARVRLDAEGIESWLVDENTASVYPFYTQAIGGVKLAVREDDAGLCHFPVLRREVHHAGADRRGGVLGRHAVEVGA